MRGAVGMGGFFPKARIEHRNPESTFAASLIPKTPVSDSDGARLTIAELALANELTNEDTLELLTMLGLETR